MPKRLSDKAYEILKHKIIDLELAPAEVIDEGALSKELGIGRTPLREAVLRLAKDDLITIVPRRGTFVSEVTITDLQELAELRVAMEAFCTRLAAQRVTESQVAAIDQLLREQSEVAENDFIRIDGFHDRAYALVHRAASNRFLYSELERLYALSQRIWNLVKWKSEGDRTIVEREARERHIESMKAIKARDAARAEALVRELILGYQRGIRSAMWRTEHT